MTKDEIIEMALEALYALAAMNHTTQQMKSNAITAIKEALAQPEQKYRRGNRLICLETEEYCVIHISGTDRQWVKFPDSHIGVYTNEQVAELFELLPKEPEPDNLELAAEKSDNYASFHAGYRFAVAHHLAQPEQEPVAYGTWDTMLGKGNRMMMVRLDKGQDGCTVPLYTTPPQRKPEQEPVAWEQFYPDIGKPQIAFNAEVIGYVAPQRTWVGLTDEDIDQGLLRTKYAMQTAGAWRDGVEWAIKQLQEKNT